MSRTSRTGWAVLAAAMGALTAPGPVAAHCDSMDGPVVRAAQEALTTGEVARVLVWIRAEDEPEIREAFERTMSVRQLGDGAQELADRWFFETLVRVHRAGEGAPYTGLKPAGFEPPGGIAAADRAIEAGAVDGLVDGVAQHLGEALRDRFQRLQSLGGYAPGDVRAGREHVGAYVDFIHFVEALHSLLQEAPDAHGSGHEGR